ncbi:hypothetical protein CBR_g79383, partial [Chara braunii]
SMAMAALQPSWPVSLRVLLLTTWSCRLFSWEGGGGGGGGGGGEGVGWAECASVPTSPSLSVPIQTREKVEQDTRLWALRLRKAHAIITPPGTPTPSPRQAGAPLPPCNATVGVGKNATYTSIQGAISQIPSSRGTRRWVICVTDGTYREKVKLRSSCTYVTLVGVSRDPTKVVVSWDDTAGSPSPTATGVGSTTSPSTLGTFDSYTFAAEASYFTAMYITFSNTAPRPNDGSEGGQAVAVRASANYMSFYHCSFLGFQDTLYAHQGTLYFRNCYIRGSVDFIFGNATAWFYDCSLYANVASKGYLTAQNRGSPTERSGFAFYKGSVRGTGVVYLGRAWGIASRVVFYEVFLDSIVAPEGWDSWGKSTDAIFYAEYNCMGPGSATAGRVNWSIKLTAEEARIFGSCDFIDAKKWQDQTGLPSSARAC